MSPKCNLVATGVKTRIITTTSLIKDTIKSYVADKTDAI